MSNELAVMPDMSKALAQSMNPEMAKQMNADAAAGISTGFAARLKMSAKTFAIVDGNGEESAVKLAELFVAPDGNGYLPAVILKSKREITKSFYIESYTPGDEGSAPDCFSNDGMMPDASVQSPQCESCAACQNNAWGSGKDAKGAPAKGKACADAKILAVYVLGKVLKVKLPPASLKNFGLYLKQLSHHGIYLGAVKTLLSFDQSSDFSIMTFTYGGEALPKRKDGEADAPYQARCEATAKRLTEIAQSQEVEEIVTDTMTASATPALAAPKAAAKQEVKPEVKKAEPVIQVVPDKPVVEDDGLGLDAVTEAATPEVVPSTEGPSDADLAAELGL